MRRTETLEEPRKRARGDHDHPMEMDEGENGEDQETVEESGAASSGEVKRRRRQGSDAPALERLAAYRARRAAGDPLRGAEESGEMDLEGDEEMSALDILLLFSNEEHVQGTGHVSEIYSPPRVAPVAASYGLEQGYSLDLTTCGPDGEFYDFDKRSCRKKARRLIQEKRPGLLICSPMCTAFSNLLK